MKVFHVVTTPESLIFLRRQAAYLRSQGLDVHIVSSPGPEFQRFAQAEGVTPHEVEMRREISPFRDVLSVVQLYGLFRRARPDIVHFHTPKASLIGSVASLLARVPCRIFQVHGLPHSTAEGFTRALLRWSTKIPALLATEVLSVSQSVVEEAVAEQFCAAHKIKCLLSGGTNGVDTKRFNPSPELTLECRKRFGFTDTDLLLGFAGRLVRDKGIAELSAAWSRIREEFPNAYLLMVGQPGPRDALPSGVLAGLQSDERVRMLGQTEDMPSFYACLDVFILPTFREGLPGVLLEAAAMAVPVVASRCIGCVDAVIDGETGKLVTPGDSCALAASIRDYFNNSALRREHGSAARARVLRDFRPEDMWLAVLNEYRAARRFAARSGFYALGKRAIDVAVSAVSLLLLAPVLGIVALLVRLGLGASVLFRQQRPGLRERSFGLLKFRTMRDENNSQGISLPDGERLTRLGTFLRRSSLDELPQLWNILRNDMSLVGPRPLLTHYLERYDDVQRRRHTVKPGITGLAQVSGRNDLSWEEKFRLDVWYVDHQSLWLDLQILARTFALVLRGKGVTQQGHATMPEFHPLKNKPAAEGNPCQPAS